jgi:large subunit ribosomal protein L16
MFLPNKSKLKFKNYHRAHIVARTSKTLSPFLNAGILGLKILKFGFLLPTQLKAIYLTLNKILKKKSIIYIFAFPNGSLTSKALGARMGKGKGKILSNWVFKIKAGFILCEIHTNFISLAIKALKLAQYKIPLASKIIINKQIKLLNF